MKTKRRPFPTFVLWLLVFLLALLTLLLRCLSILSPGGPPSITAEAEGKQMNWVVRRQAWDGAVYEGAPIFHTYGRDVVTPSQAAAGETVSISIDSLPDQVTLKEYALSADGESPYGSAVFLREYVFYFTGRTGAFTLPEPGEESVRGYVLGCAWGEDRCEYGLVIQITPE